jgi:hypothetical protein
MRARLQVAALIVLAFALARHAIAGAAARGAIPEGTQGLAYSEHASCGVDGAIVSFRESFSSWLVAEGIDDAGVPEVRDDYLRHIGAMPRSRPCIACLSADAAIRRFAPLALAASHERALAGKLRALRPIRTPADARAAEGKVLTLMARTYPDGADPDAGQEAIRAAAQALELVGNLEGTLGEEYVNEKGQWCVSFSAMEEYDDKTMETLAHAVSAGLPRRQAIGEARRLLRTLVRTASVGRRSPR